MKTRHKFKLRKANVGYYVDCVFLYRELAALCCLLWKCKFYFPEDSDLVESIYKHINSLLDDIDHAEN